MPSTGEFITDVYENVVNIGGSAAEETDHRRRLKLHLDRAVAAYWKYRPWAHKFALEGSIIAFAGDSSMLVPLDYYAPGPHTKLYKVGETEPVEHQPIRAVSARLRRAPDTRSNRPDIWCFEGQRNTQLATPGAPIVTPLDAPGGTSAFSYKVVAYLEDGVRHTAASAAGSTAVGGGVDTDHVNRITWTAVPGATYYDVYRTVRIGVAVLQKIASLLTVTTFDHTTKVDDSDAIVETATPPTKDTTPGYSGLIQFADRASVDIEFELTDYVKALPVLVDEVVSGTPSDGESLRQIPPDICSTVLWEYMAKRSMRDEGDDREPLQDADFRKGLAEAWAAQNQDQLDEDFMAPSYGEGSDD